MIELVEPTPHYLYQIALHMRPEDRKELRVLNGVSPIRGLRISSEGSMMSYVVLVYSEPVALFGVGEAGLNPLTDVGVIWFLGTPEVSKYRREFLQTGFEFIHECFLTFSTLTNLIHRDNKPALRYARHLLKRFEGDLTPEGLGYRLTLRRS